VAAAALIAHLLAKLTTAEQRCSNSSNANDVWDNTMQGPPNCMSSHLQERQWDLAQSCYKELKKKAQQTCTHLLQNCMSANFAKTAARSCAARTAV
jgi:hypothetical protein